MAFINGLFAFVFLGCLIAFLIGLVKPSVFKIKGQPLNRKQATIYSVLGAVASLVVFSATMSDEQKTAQTAKQEKAVAEQKAETLVKEETKSKQEPIQAAKVEAGLGMTPDEFRQKLNDEIIQADVRSVKPLKKIEVVDNSFRIDNISNIDMSLVGLTNSKGELRSLIYVFGGMENREDLTSLMLFTGLTAKVLSPQIKTEEKTKTIIDLMTKAAEGLEKEKNYHSKIIDGITYSATASPELGFWIGFEAK